MQYPGQCFVLSCCAQWPHPCCLHNALGQVRLLNIGELRKDQIGALTFGASIPPYKDGALPSSPKLRYAFPTAPTWQVCHCQPCRPSKTLERSPIVPQ